jgi:hypothetical protein
MNPLTIKMRDMTEQERAQFLNMQTDIVAIRQEMARHGVMLDKLYTALMGNEIAKDGGLVARILHLEETCESLQEGQIEIKEAAGKSKVYMKIMWGALGFASASLFTYVLALIFKK